MATQTQYYNLDKPSYDEVADIEIINANMDKIDQQMRNNADGVNFAKGISSDAYDNSKLYAVGDYCIYDNKLYRCITAIESAEAFNIAKWEQTTVGKEVKQLKNDLGNFNAYDLGTISSSDWKSFAKEVFSRVCGKVGAFIATVTFAGHSQCAVFGRAVASTEGDFIIITEDLPYTVFIYGGDIMTMYALNGTKM